MRSAIVGLLILLCVASAHAQTDERFPDQCSTIDADNTRMACAATVRQAAMVRERAREVAQGGVVRRLSPGACQRVILSSSQDGNPSPYALGPLDRGEYNRYLTPQENYCIAVVRSHEVPADNRYPGMLPEGWTATPLGNGAWWLHVGH